MGTESKGSPAEAPAPDIPTPVEDNIQFGWHVQIYRFDNSFGASVMRKEHGRRRFVSLIRWDVDGWRAIHPDSLYSEHLASLGALAGLSEAEVGEVLAKIAALPAPPGARPRSEPITDNRVRHSDGRTGCVTAVNLDGTVDVTWDDRVDPIGGLPERVPAALLTVIHDRVEAEPEPATPEVPAEPPVGSVALDSKDVAWQHRQKEHDDWSWWFSTAYPMGMDYAALIKQHGPLTVVYTPPTGTPPTGESRTCVGCGNTIHRISSDSAGLWVDELLRGHCTGLYGGHRPSIATEPLSVEPPVPHVYLVEQKVAGVWVLCGHVGAATSDTDATIGLEREVGDLVWQGFEARQPGDTGARWRIVQLPLVGTGQTGGA